MISCTIYMFTIGSLLLLLSLIISIIWKIGFEIYGSYLYNYCHKLVYYAFKIFSYLLEIDIVIDKPIDLDLFKEPQIILHTHASLIDNVGMFRIIEGVPFSFLAKAELF